MLESLCNMCCKLEPYVVPYDLSRAHLPLHFAFCTETSQCVDAVQNEQCQAVSCSLCADTKLSVSSEYVDSDCRVILGEVGRKFWQIPVDTARANELQDSPIHFRHITSSRAEDGAEAKLAVMQATLICQ